MISVLMNFLYGRILTRCTLQYTRVSAFSYYSTSVKFKAVFLLPIFNQLDIKLFAFQIIVLSLIYLLKMHWF